MKLLIVEYNAAVRRLIAQSVLPLAGEIRECEDGGDALSVYDRYQPDFVLMDIRMKDMDGIEATKRIKAAHPAAKIVILTD